MACTLLAYTALVASVPMTVVETPSFLRDAAEHFTETERAEPIWFLAGNPEAGDLLVETGGIRKVRWSKQGRGKRGGLRVI